MPPLHATDPSNGRTSQTYAEWKGSCRSRNGHARDGLVKPMAERLDNEGTLTVRRGPRWGRIAAFVALVLLVLFAIFIAAVWIEP